MPKILFLMMTKELKISNQLSPFYRKNYTKKLMKYFNFQNKLSFLINEWIQNNIKSSICDISSKRLNLTVTLIGNS